MCLKVKTYDEVAVFFEKPGSNTLGHASTWQGSLALRRTQSKIFACSIREIVQLSSHNFKLHLKTW